MSKVVLITGGSSGIGKSVGEYLQEKGFTVFGTSRNPKNYPNSKFPIVALDVTKKETIASCVSEVVEKASRIDVFVNNAGAGITGPVEEIPDEEIKRNFETNFFGPINVIKAVCLNIALLPLMFGPVIIITCSSSGVKEMLLGIN